MFDPLRETTPAGNPSALVADDGLAQLEAELHDAAKEFDAALDAGVPFPPDTPSLAPVPNLKRMLEELTGEDERLSIYYQGASMPDDRAKENPRSLWVWHLLWERGTRSTSR